jgi:hypothetical protein
MTDHNTPNVISLTDARTRREAEAVARRRRAEGELRRRAIEAGVWDGGHSRTPIGAVAAVSITESPADEPEPEPDHTDRPPQRRPRWSRVLRRS